MTQCPIIGYDLRVINANPLDTKLITANGNWVYISTKNNKVAGTYFF